MIKWRQYSLGSLQTNCYLVINENNSCLIIDPGSEAEKLINILKTEKLKPQAILITHAHSDHIGAVENVRNEYNIPVYVHENEAKWLLEPSLNGSQFYMEDGLIRTKPADAYFVNDEEKVVGDFTFYVYETPGHSPGGVSFYFKEEQFVITGDALFAGSIGRSDFPGGNHTQLLESIHSKLLTLPEETQVLPGHGPVTTIGNEMNGNPYLNGF